MLGKGQRHAVSKILEAGLMPLGNIGRVLDQLDTIVPPSRAIVSAESTGNLFEIINCRVAHRDVDLIFVHGLGGSWDATWCEGGFLHENYWPRFFGEDSLGVGVFAFRYDSELVDPLSNTMRIDEIADQLLSSLLAIKEGADRLIFVCHSLGGLVVKELLARHVDSEWALPVLSRVSGVAFLGTPHYGSNLANVSRLPVIRGYASRQVKDLSAENEWLCGLCDRYGAVSSRLGLRTIVFYETKTFPIINKRIVSEASSKGGLFTCELVPVDKSHCELAFCDRRDLVFKRLSTWITA